MFLNRTDFARWCKVSIPMVGKSRSVHRESDGCYDTRNKINIVYGRKRNDGKQPTKKNGYIDRRKEMQAAGKSKPYRPTGPTGKGGRPPGVKNGEGQSKDKHDLEIQKLQATVNKLNIAVDTAREELVDRDIVRRMFGQIFQIDRNEFIPLAGNLAAEAAGLCGKEDPDIINKITTNC